MQNQILVGGDWVDGDPTVDGQRYRIKIPVGNGKFGYQEQDFVLSPTASKMVGMAALGEELHIVSDSIMLEIKDFELDDTTVLAKRKIATRILFLINSNREMDVFGSEFTTMITQIGANTSLGVQSAIDLIAKMQS